MSLFTEILSYLERKGKKVLRGRSHYAVVQCIHPENHKNGDKRPSLLISTSGYHCFNPACDLHKGGKLTDLIKDDFFRDFSPSSVQTAKEENKKEKINIFDEITVAHRDLLDLIKEENIHEVFFNFFKSRGFIEKPEELEDFIKRYHLGFSMREGYRGRLIIPYFNSDGEPIYFTGRLLIDDPEEPKYKNSGGKKRVYNSIAFEYAKEKGFLLVVEGEIDTISVQEAMSNTYPVVGIAGSGFTEHITTFFKNVAQEKINVLVLTDPDKAGESLAAEVIRIVASNGGRARRVYLHADGEIWQGDVNEALQKYGKEGLRKMLDNILHQAKATGDLWFFENIQFFWKRQRNKAKYPTGIEQLDQLLGGGYEEGLHVIGGITAIGKTSFALHIATVNAEQERPVLFVSYEMSKLELWIRILAHYTGIFPEELRVKEKLPIPNTDDFKKVIRHLRIEEGNGEQPWGVREIEIEAEAIKTEEGIPPLIIIDYIQRMPAPKELQRRDLRERIDYIVTHLQVNVARRIGSPVITLSSIARSKYKTDDKFEAKISAFKESGGIEYTGYTVLLIYKDEDGDVIIDLLKNRQTGQKGAIRVTFDPRLNNWSGIG